MCAESGPPARLLAKPPGRESGACPPVDGRDGEAGLPPAVGGREDSEDTDGVSGGATGAGEIVAVAGSPRVAVEAGFTADGWGVGVGAVARGWTGRTTAGAGLAADGVACEDAPRSTGTDSLEGEAFAPSGPLEDSDSALIRSTVDGSRLAKALTFTSSPHFWIRSRSS